MWGRIAVVGVGSVFSSFAQISSVLRGSTDTTGLTQNPPQSTAAVPLPSRTWGQGVAGGASDALGSAQAERSWRGTGAARVVSGASAAPQDGGTDRQQNNALLTGFIRPLGSFLAQLLGQQSAPATSSQNFRASSAAAASYQVADQLGQVSVSQNAADLNIPGLPPLMASGKRLDLSV